MSYQAKIKRYLQILQLIEKSKYPTSAEMLDRMSETGIKVSDRQLKRDIESLRAEFGLDIHYSVNKRGYYLENEEQTFPYFLKLLEFSQNMEPLTSYLKEDSNIADIPTTMNDRFVKWFYNISFFHHALRLKISINRSKIDCIFCLPNPLMLNISG